MDNLQRPSLQSYCSHTWRETQDHRHALSLKPTGDCRAEKPDRLRLTSACEQQQTRAENQLLEHTLGCSGVEGLIFPTSHLSRAKMTVLSMDS